MIYRQVFGSHARDVLGSMSEKDACAQVQKLAKGLAAIPKQFPEKGSNMKKHNAAQRLIKDFSAGGIGKNLGECHADNGFGLAPLLPHDDITRKPASMLGTLEAKLLEQVGDGGPFQIRELPNLNPINSQRRYMVEFMDKRKPSVYLGEAFSEAAGEMAQTLAFLLQAIDYGERMAVDVEKLTLLLSAAGDQVQVRCYLELTPGV